MHTPTSLHPRAAAAPEGAKPLALTLLGLVVGLIAAIQLAGAASEQLLTLNSDQLYLPSLYRDLFVEHGDLGSWALPPAPSFFPDFVVYAIAERLTASVGAAFMLAVGIQFVSIVVLGALLFRSRTRKSCRVPVLEAVLSGTLLVVLVSDHPMRHDFFSVAHHGGALVAGLAIAVLWGRALEAWRPFEGALLAALALLGAVSDAIVLPQLFVPLVAATVAVVATRRRTLAEAARPAGAALAGLGLALGASLALSARTAHESDIAPAAAPSAGAAPGPSLFHLTPAVVEGNLRHLAGALPAPFVLLLVVATVAAGFALRGALQNGAAERRYRPVYVCVLFLSCMACSLVGPVLTVGVDPRYELPVYFLPAIFLPPCMDLLGWRRAARRTFLPAISVLAVPAARDVWARSAEQTPVPLPSTEAVACVDRVAEEDGLRYGFADYWHARALSFHSARHLAVNELTSALRPRAWISSTSWYARVREARPERVFVVSAGLPVERFEGVFGRAARVASCGELDVYEYEYEGLSKEAKEAMGVGER